MRDSKVNIESRLEKSINALDPIHLEDMGKVSLMDRVDTKYWFNRELLSTLLEMIQDDYYILTIDGMRSLPYVSTYYDTPNNAMFTAHHNGKGNRFKVRKRTYLINGLSYLEVKNKTNKGRTIKHRINTDKENLGFSGEDMQFLQQEIPIDAEQLQQSLSNYFQRLMLVNKDFSERCTIDLVLSYKHKSTAVTLDELVIVEVKSGRGGPMSPIELAMRDLRIKSAGFSKYCMGRLMTDATVKQNAFKAKVRRLSKVMNNKL